MVQYFKLRVPKKSLIFALLISSSFVIIQMVKDFQFYNHPINFFESPYTRWFSIDPFSFSPMFFFFVLPIIASIPASSMLKEDLNSGMIYKIMNRHGLSKTLSGYAITAFTLGFLVLMVPLLFNFATYFSIFPNVKPNQLLNENLLIIDQNTQFVNLYFNHPMAHTLLFIFFAGLWGGIFATLNCMISIFFKNRLFGIFACQFIQLIILAMNMFIKLPNFVSYSPVDFVKEASASNVSVSVSLVVTVVFIIATIILGVIGRYKKIV